MSPKIGPVLQLILVLGLTPGPNSLSLIKTVENDVFFGLNNTLMSSYPIYARVKRSSVIRDIIGDYSIRLDTFPAM